MPHHMARVETLTHQTGPPALPTRRPDGVSAPARRRHAVTTVTPRERARVLRQAKRHSLFVRLLRISLPLAAVLSFGLYFAKGRIEIALPDGKFSGEIPTLSSDNLKMDNPRYEGFTAEGGKFVVSAKTGYQDFRNPSTIRLITIDSHLTQPNEQWAHLVSNEGIYDTKADLLKLSGNIKVTSSNGMTAHLKTADVLTKTQIVTSRDPVVVEMSNGTTVESDAMVLNARTKEVTFEGQVRTHLVRAPVAGKTAAGATALTERPAPVEEEPATDATGQARVHMAPRPSDERSPEGAQP